MSTHPQNMKEWLKKEPFTLALSSGFFGFYAHCGVVMALEKNGLIPSKIVGASAGALVGGLWASGLNSELISAEILRLKRSDFWDPGLGFGFLKGKLFQSKLADILPVNKLEECKINFSPSVYSLASRKTVSVRNGCMPSAIRASCAVPVMFQPVRVNNFWALDGGISERSGLDASNSGERVLYHHLLPRSPRNYTETSEFLSRGTQLKTFEITGLPRVNPFRLERGERAMIRAFDATMQLLDQAVEKDLIKI
jgi:NTE family protein